jgi:hypothetical protein
MKHSMRLLLAIVITAILATTAIVVWASSPMRQGTVPIPPTQLPIVPGIPVTLGTAQGTITCVDGQGTIFRYTDPATKFGPAPTGLRFLNDGITIELNKSCELKVCFPYPKSISDAEGKIYKWDSVAKAWIVVTSTSGSDPISVIEGTPQQICVIDKNETTGSYSLLGK